MISQSPRDPKTPRVLCSCPLTLVSSGRASFCRKRKHISEDPREHPSAGPLHRTALQVTPARTKPPSLRPVLISCGSADGPARAPASSRPVGFSPLCRGLKISRFKLWASANSVNSTKASGLFSRFLPVVKPDGRVKGRTKSDRVPAWGSEGPPWAGGEATQPPGAGPTGPGPGGEPGWISRPAQEARGHGAPTRQPGRGRKCPQQTPRGWKVCLGGSPRRPLG